MLTRRTLIVFGLFLGMLAVPAEAQIGRRFPSIQIPAPGNAKIDLDKYRGKILVLALLSTTCEECIHTMGVLTTVQNEKGNGRVQVVAATANTIEPAEVAAFIKKYKPPFPVGFVDPTLFQKIAAIGPEVRPFVPTLLYMDAKGIVRYQYYGNHIHGTAEQTIPRIVDELLLGKRAKQN